MIQLGIAIASVRRLRDMTQEQLAEKAGISRTFLSPIEAPGTSRSFSLEVLYSISDALNVKAGDLLNYADYPEKIINNK
ncbi:MAG: helix-turn-helix transcriptional regulator [Oscillospiraceae bacterium]|nr:helix-turn-helix transcriptional regulator [Candidatus Equicaccousia limihippi]